MNQTHLLLIMIGLATGLMIALVAIVAMGSRTTPPPVIVMSPPPASSDMGCGGMLIFIPLLLLALIFWLMVLA